ncbi:hypothetical protein [Azoarcus sp. KH32C]|uniref:hypothetical protein n=1 Tax=Azoarcus sp. KH32C TaxID=748247 RepID=UPI00155B3C4A|nr:hypothetical protein [Azoarcus sp. KH32C]
MLLSAALPAYAARIGTNPTQEPPRLRLSLAISGLTQESAAAPAPTSPDEPPLSPLLPPLKLSLALMGRTASEPGNNIGSGELPSRNAPSTPPAQEGTPGPAPAPDERRSWKEKAVLPSRRQSPPEKQQTGEQYVAGPAGKPEEPAAASGKSSSDAKVVGSEEFLPADELEPSLPPVRPAPSGKGAVATEEDTSKPRRAWGMAPIRWGGTLSAGIQQSRSGDSSSSLNEVYEARMRVNSYIWAPYIAVVSGDFGLITTRSSAASGDNSAASNNLTGTSINGSGSLNLFPQSRFPFTANLSLADSRSMGSFTDTNVQYRRLGLLQTYRPLSGAWNANGGYDRSEVTGNFGGDTVDRLHGNFSTRIDNQNFNASASASRSESENTSYNDFFVSGSHNYQFDEEWSIGTTGSYTGQNFSTRSADGTAPDTNVKATSAQLFSVANWNPLDSKWRGSGTLRYFQTSSTASAGNALQSSILGGTAGLSYQASRNLSLFGSFGFNGDDKGNSSTFESAGGTYSGDPLSFGEYAYTWSSSVSGSNSSASNTSSARSVTGSASHSLMRSWLQENQGTLSASISQSVSASQSTGIGSNTSHSIGHSASLSYSANPTETLNGYLSASLSDTRTFGETNSAFQMLNVQVSGQWRISAYSALTSNLTWQTSRQQSDSNTPVVITDEFGRPLLVNQSTQNQNTSLSGSLSYSHSRFLGFRGLRYGLDFRANTAHDESRRFGNPDAPREPERASLDLDQRLGYRIGRLDTQLQFRVAEIQGNRNQLLYLRLSRDFGAF